MGFILVLIFRGFGVSIFSVVGVTATILSLIVLCKREMRSSPLNVVLFALQASDLLCFFVQIFTGISTLWEAFGWRNLLMENSMTRIFVNMVYWAAKMSSHYHILCLCFLRYIAVCSPLQARSICRRRRSVIAALTVFGVSLSCSLTRGYYVTLDNRALQRIGWLILETVILYVIPIAVILFTNISIFLEVKSSESTRSNLASSRLREENSHLNNLLFSITATFIMCNSINIIDRILYLIDAKPYWFYFYIVDPFSDFLMVTNALTNSIYYSLFSPQFRTILKQLIVGPESHSQAENLPLIQINKEQKGRRSSLTSDLHALQNSVPFEFIPIPKGRTETLI